MTYIHGRISVDAHLAHRPEAPRLTGLRARNDVEFGVDALIVGLRQTLDSNRETADAPGRPRRSTRPNRVAAR
jgi:hypothetical protein